MKMRAMLLKCITHFMSVFLSALSVLFTNDRLACKTIFWSLVNRKKNIYSHKARSKKENRRNFRCNVTVCVCRPSITCMLLALSACIQHIIEALTQFGFTPLQSSLNVTPRHRLLVLSFSERLTHYTTHSLPFHQYCIYHISVIYSEY